MVLSLGLPSPTAGEQRTLMEVLVMGSRICRAEEHVIVGYRDTAEQAVVAANDWRIKIGVI